MIEDHVDAILAAGVVAFGSFVTHMMTVARMQASIKEMREDLKDIKGTARRTGKRFHWLNNFSMGLYASIKRLSDSLGVPMTTLEGYDFEHENGEDE